MRVAFWTLLGLLVYTWIGYPALLYIASRIKPSRSAATIATSPSVSFIITARNEQNIIVEKLWNTISQSYSELSEIIVVSDGSTDSTVELARTVQDPRLKVIDLAPGVGKTEAQNTAVRLAANGDILVFSDANAMYDADAVQALVAALSDPRVGMVGGRLTYVSLHGSHHEGLYVRYDNAIKKLQGTLGVTIGVQGSIYAVRREAFQYLPGHVISDFGEAIAVLLAGWQVSYTGSARSYEVEEPQQFGRKARIVSRCLLALKQFRTSLNPLAYPNISFHIVSYKILRYAGVWILLALLVTSALLIPIGRLYYVTTLMQVLFYGLAIVGSLVRLPSLMTFPRYFVQVNSAAALGMWYFLTRRVPLKWTPSRSR